MKKVFLSTLSAIALGAVVYFGIPKYYEHQAKEHVKQVLKDPVSALFDMERSGHDKRVCGYVNSKNGFGAYAGRARFYFNADKGILFIEGDSDYIDKTIRESWSKWCS